MSHKLPRKGGEWIQCSKFYLTLFFRVPDARCGDPGPPQNLQRNDYSSLLSRNLPPITPPSLFLLLFFLFLSYVERGVGAKHAVPRNYTNKRACPPIFYSFCTFFLHSQAIMQNIVYLSLSLSPFSPPLPSLFAPPPPSPSFCIFFSLLHLGKLAHSSHEEFNSYFILLKQGGDVTLHRFPILVFCPNFNRICSHKKFHS